MAEGAEKRREDLTDWDVDYIGRFSPFHPDLPDFACTLNQRNVGSWPNRDPIGEKGFKLIARKKHSKDTQDRLNDYRFVKNAPISSFDMLGLFVGSPDTSGFEAIGRCLGRCVAYATAGKKAKDEFLKLNQDYVCAVNGK